MPIAATSIVGFFDETLAMQFFKQACYFPNATDASLQREWQTARAKIGPAVGTPGVPSIKDIPSAHAARLAGIPSNPAFPPTVRGMLSSEFKLVEVGQVLAWQHYVEEERSS